MTDHLTTREAAERIGVTIQTVNRWVREGLLVPTSGVVEVEWRKFAAAEIARWEAERKGRRRRDARS